MSWSPTRIRPPILVRPLGRSRINARIVTDLPEPDSPMMHSTSPGWIAKETPFTAETVASRLTNWTRRSSTSTSGLAAARATGPVTAEAAVIVVIGLSSSGGGESSGGGFRPGDQHRRLACQAVAGAGRLDMASGDVRVGGHRANQTRRCLLADAFRQGQRVRKRQPEGGLMGLGGSPVNGAS